MTVPSFPSEAEARHEEGFLNSSDHLRLFWQRYTPASPRGTVVVLHGAGDHSGRYPAVTTALVRAGFQVALVDLRGHGQSDGRRWHVDAFSDYVADLSAFVAKLRADGASGKLWILAHSHGALVAAAWGLEHGRDVDGFVLSSPYFRLALRPPMAKLLAAKLVGRIAPWLPISAGLDLQDLSAFVAKLRADGASGKLWILAHSHGALVAAAWGLEHGRDVDGFVLSSPYFRLALRPPMAKLLAAKLVGRIAPWLPISAGLDLQDLTSDPELQRWTARDPLYSRSTTPRWFGESTRAQVMVLRRAPRFEAPLLVLAAGADRIADVAAARAFVDAARSADKRLSVYDGFRHEIFNEIERDRPIAEAIAWLSSHSK